LGTTIVFGFTAKGEQMKNNIHTQCPRCLKDLESADLIGDLIVCRNCSYSGDLKVKSGMGKILSKARGASIPLFFVGFSLAVIYMIVSADQKTIADSRKFEMESKQAKYLESNWDRINALGTQEILRQCTESGDISCQVLAYKKLWELDPTSRSFGANYAARLTLTSQHKKAVRVFKKLEVDNSFTWDMMAYYAKSLKALGKIEEAQKWNELALQVNPMAVDVTADLSDMLIKKGKVLEAYSLLNSQLDSFPSMKSWLDPHLVKAKEKISKEKIVLSEKSIQLVAPSGRHHFVPVVLGDKRAVERFMIDTGATDMVAPTSAIKKSLPSLIGTGQQTRGKLADGRVVNMELLRIKNINIMGFEIQDVTLSHCEGCSYLLGKSALKNFNMKVESKGNLEYMTLSRQN
jgi:tetratricopeptide (TPR) repeat protein